MSTIDLIRRARELAKLAEKATPGPWRLDSDGDTVFGGTEDIKVIVSTEPGVLETPDEYDLKLVAASWEAVRLLGQLADELDWIIKWALERCYHECGQGFLERGMHGPDCLIDELALDDLVEHEEFQRKRGRP